MKTDSTIFCLLTTIAYLMDHFRCSIVGGRGGWRSGKISASQSWGSQFDPRPGRGLNIWVTFLPTKIHSDFIPHRVGKMSTSIYGWFEVAAKCACICFWSAGGKPIIVKRLCAFIGKKALYKCTTLLFLLFTLFVLGVVKPRLKETWYIKQLLKSLGSLRTRWYLVVRVCWRYLYMTNTMCCHEMHRRSS